jgi:copper chaperone CopZ
MHCQPGPSCCDGVGGRGSSVSQGPSLFSSEDCTDDAFVSSKKTTRRSTFYIQEICCASEVPAIRSIIARLDGIDNIRVNVTSKLLYVDHDVSQIDASVICQELNRERFGARIDQDGAIEIDAPSGMVTSVLSFGDPIATHDREAIGDFFASFGSIVTNAVVDDDGKRVTIVHNSLLLSALDAASRMSGALGLATTVLTDGGGFSCLEFLFCDGSRARRRRRHASGDCACISPSKRDVLWHVHAFFYWW